MLFSPATLLRSSPLLTTSRTPTLLGLQRRAFSTVKPRVFSNAVFMPELFPARLTIPTARGMYDFTLDNQTKVTDFCQLVLENTDKNVSSFELLASDSSKQSRIDKLTLGELKQQKFAMKVNGKTFDVYPDLTSILRNPDPVTRNKREVAKIEDIENSIPICRQTILRDYYFLLVSEMKKSAGTGNKISQDKLNAAFEKAIQSYADTNLADSERARSTLAMLRAELEEQQKQHEQLVRQAHKRAGMMLGLGFMGCMAQLVGFGVGIYVVYDWNEMEPWTWIACK